MTNLDSIFKSRDITLPTKVRLVKAVFFPVVVYGKSDRLVLGAPNSLQVVTVALKLKDTCFLEEKL